MDSKEKGKRGELELSHILTSHGFEARRGQQYCGANGDADVIGIPGFHLEVKRVEKLNINMAMAQSINDAKPDEIPVVVHRKNRKPWLVTMRLEEWIGMIKNGSHKD